MASKDIQFLHSTYWKNKAGTKDAEICVFKHIDTGENFLQIINNPTTSISVTRKELRGLQNCKIICESPHNVETRVIPYVEMQSQMQDMLYGNTRYKVNPRKMWNSPYVYNADVNIGVRIKQKTFLDSGERLSTKYHVGGLDIETDMVGNIDMSYPSNEAIIVISYTTPDLHTYTGILKQFIGDIPVEQLNKDCDIAIAEYSANVNDEAKAIIKEKPISYENHIFESELEMITWIFKMIHKTKPGHVSIWNMNFDIKHILQRIKTLGGNRWDIIPHPEVPKGIRVCKYREDDNPNLAHFTYAWHVFEASGYTWYYDSQNTYSRLRKFDGVLDSYALDAILNKHCGAGKRNLSEGGHTEMQTSRKSEYVAYNNIDTVALPILDMIIHDVESMHTDVPKSDLQSFAQQTVRLRNEFYAHCKTINKVAASQRGGIERDCDEEISNVGGNVISPGLAWRTTVKKCKELVSFTRKLVSKLCLLVFDIDVTLSPDGSGVLQQECCS